MKMRYYECANCDRVYVALDKSTLFEGREWNPGVDIDDFEDPPDEERCIIKECPDCFEPLDPYEEQIECDRCGNIFPDTQATVGLYRQALPGKEVLCPDCSKMLRNPKLTHYKKYQCQFCNSVFEAMNIQDLLTSVTESDIDEQEYDDSAPDHAWIPNCYVCSDLVRLDECK